MAARRAARTFAAAFAACLLFGCSGNGSSDSAKTDVGSTGSVAEVTSNGGGASATSVGGASTTSAASTTDATTDSGTGSVAASATTTGADTTGADTAGGGTAGDGLRPTAFVTTRGRHFDEAGQRHVFVGANFWQGMNLGADDATGDRERLLRELDRLQALGIKNLRVMAASEGPDSEPYRVVPSLMPSPGEYNEAVFQGLDYFLNELSKRGMRAVMVLNNYWEWTGGMAQYVSWGEGTQIPYRLDTNDYQRFIDYVDRFYACSECQQMYRAHVEAVVQRVNSITGLAYRDDPSIFSWQLANEPRNYPANWVGDVAEFIKSLDPNHMVSTGSEGNWNEDFLATHQSEYVDYATCHVWVEPWQIYDANDENPANLQTSIDFMTDYLEEHEAEAAQLDKPLVLEEFGLARDGWTAGGKLDPAATTTNREAYYKAVYGLIEASLSQDGFFAGDNFWAWGGEARPPSAWTGDPPHEEPGWFSIYDTDAPLLDILRAHSENVEEYVQPLP